MEPIETALSKIGLGKENITKLGTAAPTGVPTDMPSPADLAKAAAPPPVTVQNNIVVNKAGPDTTVSVEAVDCGHPRHVPRRALMIIVDSFAAAQIAARDGPVSLCGQSLCHLPGSHSGSAQWRMVPARGRSAPFVVGAPVANFR
jgi:hypothetical protein